MLLSLLSSKIQIKVLPLTWWKRASRIFPQQRESRRKKYCTDVSTSFQKYECISSAAILSYAYLMQQVFCLQRWKIFHQIPMEITFLSHTSTDSLRFLFTSRIKYWHFTLGPWSSLKALLLYR